MVLSLILPEIIFENVLASSLLGRDNILSKANELKTVNCFEVWHEGNQKLMHCASVINSDSTKRDTVKIITASSYLHET